MPRDPARGPKPPPAPPRLPTLHLVSAPIDDTSDALCGGFSDGTSLYLAGGLARNLVLVSTDGETFSPVPTKGRGLRNLHVDGDEVWLIGEYGTLYRSTTGFAGLALVPLRTSACLHGLAKADDGSMWVGGDSGFLVRIKGDKPVAIAGVEGTIGKMVATPLGVLIPATGLWLGRGDTVTKLGLDKKINHAIRTRKGTILAVGKNNRIYRSKDGGVTFKSAKRPLFEPMAGATAVRRPSWVRPAKDLNVIAELADGRIVVGGDEGVVLGSSDGGKSFHRVENLLFAGAYWGVGTFRGDVFLVGECRTIIRAS